MEGESTLTTNNEGGSSSLPTTHSNDIVIIIAPAGALPEIEVEYEQHLESYHRTVSTIYFLRRLIIEEFDRRSCCLDAMLAYSSIFAIPGIQAI